MTIVNAPQLSFEFFPPKNTVQERRFWRSFGALELLCPSFVSVTWGALGVDAEPSMKLLESLTKDTSVPVVAHLACSGMNISSASAVLDKLSALGVTRLLALRGDAPKNTGDTSALRHATDLVQLAAAHGDFEISVAGYPEVHPESSNSLEDMHWLRRKAELGASKVVTQFFFDTDNFLRWRDEVAAQAPGLTVIPGILPIEDIDKVTRFAAVCGSHVPNDLVTRFTALKDASDRSSLAVEVAAKMCDRMQSEAVEQFHIYTLNRSTLPVRIASALGVTSALDPLAA